MALKGFERRLERMVEGAFARAFRSGIRPVELGRRLTREMDDNRSIGVRGEPVVPNLFTFALSAEDHEQFEDVFDGLRRELAEAAREHARDEGYRFMGPVEIGFEIDERRRAGSFDLSSRLKEGPGGTTGAALVLPGGERFALDETLVTVGRMSDCNIVLADPNVSRNHAEIRPDGDSWRVTDLGSTNGTKVNGVRVRDHVLRDGDEVAFGNTVVRFEAG